MQATPYQIEVNDLYHELGTAGAVAKRLGKNKTSIIKALFYGAKKGLAVMPDNYSPVAPAGWSSTFKTVQYKGNGEVVQTWDRVKPNELEIEALYKFLEDRTPVLAKEIPAPKNANKDLMLEWLLMDHHLGLHAWGKETGSDYDTGIAQELIERAADKIFSRHGNVKKAVIVFGGDNTHADNRANQTEKSKHSLDVDSRYGKNMNAIYQGVVTSIDIALGKAEEVDGIILSGNHDFHSAICLAIILKAHYRKNKRVHIDTSPSKHKFIRFGSNYFMYTHGDTGGNRLAGYMLNHIVKQGLHGIERMYVRKGHLHKRGRTVPPGLTEEDGVIIEIFPTLAAPDSFSHEQAYSQCRATVVNLWHERYGQRSRMELGVRELMEDAA